MKIRIGENSMRFRLKQPEVKHFQQHGIIAEVLEFGPNPANQLRFELEISSISECAVDYTSGHIILYVPKNVAEEWFNTDMVGFGTRVDTGRGREMELLVEKDFQCLNRPEEDNTGAYPNPKAVC